MRLLGTQTDDSCKERGRHCPSLDKLLEGKLLPVTGCLVSQRQVAIAPHDFASILHRKSPFVYLFFFTRMFGQPKKKMTVCIYCLLVLVFFYSVIMLSKTWNTDGSCIFALPGYQHYSLRRDKKKKKVVACHCLFKMTANVNLYQNLLKLRVMLSFCVCAVAHIYLLWFIVRHLESQRIL